MQPNPPKSRRQIAIQQSRAFVTRTSVLDAAERLLAQSGPTSLTLEQVAREAELSKGALLYHFPNKESLHTELAKRLCIDFLEEADTLRVSSGEKWCISALDAIESGSTKYASLISILTVISDLQAENWAEVDRSVMARLEADGLDENLQSLVYCVICGFATFSEQDAQRMAPRVKAALKARILTPHE